MWLVRRNDVNDADPLTVEFLSTLPHKKTVNVVRFSPDGTLWCLILFIGFGSKLFYYDR